MPSTAQWCSFSAIANEPFGTPGTEFSPSMTVISHGGRRRSICRAKQPRNLDTELSPVTGLGQPDMTDVILEIEVRVVHPVRPMETAGQLGQPPPKDIREMQPGVEFLENPLEGHLAARGGRRVIDQQQLNL